MIDYLYKIANDEVEGAAASAVKFILFLLSLVYCIVLKMIAWLYSWGLLWSYRSPAKVISVGNITWGGTGKTPLVQMLADELTRQGKKVAVVIRGYKSRGSSGGWRNVGDEAFMLSEALGSPILTGRNRVASAKKARGDLGVGTIILDDGFQHWPLKRDLDIVVIDSTNPFGNGFLIPRGILREPLSALRRAQVFFLTRTDQCDDIAGLKERLEAVNPKALIVESVHHPVAFCNLRHHNQIFGPKDIKGRIALICSVGNPGAFENTLRELGLLVQLKFIFPDHHDYKPEEIRSVLGACKAQAIDALLTTRKDEVRLREFLQDQGEDLKILVLQVKLVITKGQDEFFGRLSRLYSA
jgi:tetraacyldisaccharide 4'-kinase